MSAESAAAAHPAPSLTPEAMRAARMIPFIVGCALFMQMLDATVVATALPAMARALGSTPVRLNVAITSYLLSVAVFVPVSGWAADRYGARRVFVAAIGLFTLSSVACALSQDLPQLVAARVVQGMAGAMMVPVGRIILLRTVPKQDLLKAMSFLSIPALLGPVIGPPLGGFMVTYMSWHWIFLINIPIGILGIFLVLRYVEEIRVEGAPRLDWPGFLLSAICLATLVSGFEAIGRDVMPLPMLLGLIATGLACGLLYGWHARRAPHPIIDLSLMRIPTFAIATLGGNLCRFAVGATPFLLAMLLQVGFGLSPFSAGLITFASAAGALLMKFVATPIVQHFGFRRVLTVNALLTGIFIVVCGAFTPATPVWLMIAVLLVGGFFRSLQFTGVNTLTYADIPPTQMSRASSFAAMAQQLGISLGVGVAAVTLNISMALRGAETLAIRDVVAGFIVIGVLCMASVFSFGRLDPLAGAHLNGAKNRDDE
ncbi:MFS transporter [Achromobacter sp. HZ01]|jgi:EmrB/QacA subfamily drug resistance transporter|uniref:MFS transporter n=1 Tax=Achromobacter sp. HZ01 TaxID=1416886 RepID=UPI000DC37303|nr:MFS transporter [Achromobacter sp. HZ01]MBO9332753.1 MFS transporter [Achromobacter xylosoxidans]RAP60728.1 MFS transporter [Achromobacter sp. HZ01]